MSQKITPLLDRVLVKRDPTPQLYPAGVPGLTGLEIPPSERDKFQPNTGKVVDVGPGQYVNGNFCPTAAVLHESPQVLFAPMGGTPVDHDGSEHLLMREADVLSVLTK